MPDTGGFFAGSIYGRLTLDTAPFNAAVATVDKTLTAAGSKVSSFGKSISNLGKGFSDTGRQLSMSLTAPLALIGGFSLKLAVAAQESENLFKVSMGNMADDARKWSVALGESLGLNDYQIRKTVGTFNVMLGSMGLTEQAAYSMAKGMTKLTYDMSSFYDVPIEEAFQKIQSGISGEVEPLKRLGIIVNETTVKIWAIKNGLVAQGQEMTEQQKVIARYGAIMEQTKKAQGDWARTIDSPSNKLKALKANAEKMGIELGQRLIPFMQQAMDVISKGMKWWDGLSDSTKNTAIKIGLVVAAIGPLLMAFGSVLKMIGLLTSGIGGAITGIGRLASALSVGLVAWGAAAAAIGYYILKLREKKEAEDYANEAEARSTARLKEYQDKLYGIIAAVGVSKEKWAELTAKYGDNANALRQAILAGEAGVDAQKALADYTDKTSKATKDAKTETSDYTVSLGDLTKGLGDATTANKAWTDYMKDAGIKTTQEQSAEVQKLYGYLDTLGKMYDAGQISSEAYAKGAKKVSDDLADLGVKANAVLPPARDMSGVMATLKTKIGELPRPLENTTYGFGMFGEKLKAIYPELKSMAERVRAFALEMMKIPALMKGMIPPSISVELGGWSQGVKDTVTDTMTGSGGVTDIFAGGMNDIAQKFGDTFAAFVQEGFNFKTLWNGLWQGLKDTFFTILGEMATKFIKDFLGSILSNAVDTAGKAASSIASTASSAVSGISNVLSGGLATAIGSFAGTFLAGVLGGGPSGHQQQQAINDTKDSRNFLAEIRNWFVSAGSGFGSAVWEFLAKFEMEKFDGLKGSVDLSRDSLNPKIDEANGWLRSIDGRLAGIGAGLEGTKSAQAGAVVTTTELVKVHGTPSRPEYIIPAPDLEGMMAGGRRGGGDVVVNVALNGQIVTDREYTRTRIIPEIIEAARSGLKSQLQAALGVA